MDMDKDTIIRLARAAGMRIHEGDQDRVLYEGSIVDALTKFASLVRLHGAEQPHINTP